MAGFDYRQRLGFAPRDRILVARRDGVVARAQLRLPDTIVLEALEQQRGGLEDIEYEHHRADEQNEELHGDLSYGGE